MDLFVLKKIIGYLLMPLPLTLLLMLVALFYVNTNPVRTRRLLLSAFLILLASTLPITSDLLTKPIENHTQFSKQSKSLNYIVTLGCGHNSNDNWAASNQLKPCSLQRLVETLRIHRLHPEAQIIFSGDTGQSVSNAETMMHAAISLGIPASKILLEPYPKDTEEEAMLVAPRVAGSRFALVTNGDHMIRAVNYFNRYGATAIPAPASPWVMNGNSSAWDHVPTASNLKQTTHTWHEIIGLLWQWLKGNFS